MDPRYALSLYITSPDTVPRSDDTELLGTVLSLAEGSHDGVFLYNRQGTFLGLISPERALYKKRLPPTTNAVSVLFSPPSITANTPIPAVAAHMLGSRIYTLPVFDEKRHIVGVVQAKAILKGVLRDPLFLTYVSRLVRPRKPITYPVTGTIRKAYALLKHYSISRLILATGDGKLAGILARSDIKNAFIAPVPHQRFSKTAGDAGYFAFDTEEVYRLDNPVSTYMTARVRTISDRTDMRTLVKTLLSSDTNSLVLIDGRNRPTGFLSTRDILQAVASLTPETDVPIIMKNPGKTVSRVEIASIRKTMDGFIAAINKRRPLAKVALRFEESTYPDSKTAVFTTSLVVTPVKGQDFVAKVTSKAILDGLQEAMKEIKRQERKHARRPEHIPLSLPA